MQNNDIALIRKAQQGNMMAFETLVRKYDKQVLTLAYNMVNDTEDAKDIYQEVFLRAYRGLGKFKFESEFSTWLYRITTNYAINFRKRRTRHQMMALDMENEDQGAWQIVDEDQKPGEEVLDSEFHSLLDEAIGVLPPQQRSVFVLRHYHGHKLSEIAEIMDCNLGTVKNYLYRATRKIQQQLKGYLQE